MDPRLKQKRIPTLVAFVLLIVGVGVAFLLVQRGTFIVSQAAPDYQPQSVRVSNITPYSFTVTFITVDPSVATVKLDGEDDHFFDQQGTETEVTAHSIVVGGLSPSSEYSFSITSHGDEYQDSLYTAQTAPESEEIPENETLQGRVLLPAGGAAAGALVYFSVPESQLLSTITDSDGRYEFRFSEGLRTRDLAGFVILEAGDRLNLVSARGGLSSEVTALYSTSLPPITLSRDFDFTTQTTIPTESTQSATLPLPEGQQGFSFSVLSPTQDAFLVDAQPIISGTAFPSTRVSLQLVPANIQTSVPVNENGRWEFRPADDLPQGQNTLSAVGVDVDGTSRAIDVSFDVFPSGSRIAQSATPSATPIVTVTATPTPPVVDTPTLTPTPTQAIGGTEPSITPTPTDLPTPTPTPFLKITPTPPGSLSGVFLTFASLAFIVTGATLLFLLG